MSNISAKIIAHSQDGRGNEIVTFELEYPRIIHSELMTHRLFSRNAASSRAIPVKTLIEMVRNEPAMPERFGANQPGMQDKGAEHDGMVGAGYTGREWWGLASLSAARFAEELAEAGYHKQIANRLLEPFQRMKTVLTTTELENFWWLRVDADADPTIEALAKEMHKVYQASEAELLLPGQWHTPYVDHIYGIAPGSGDMDAMEFQGYCVYDEDDKPVRLTTEEAKAISSSCTAQVSYRRLNSTKDKALDIYGRLLSGQKVHASPFEHQATPMEQIDQLSRTQFVLSTQEINQDTHMWEEGVTHVDRQGLFWSGNFKGFIQHRQLLDNHSKW